MTIVTSIMATKKRTACADIKAYLRILTLCFRESVLSLYNDSDPLSSAALLALLVASRNTLLSQLKRCSLPFVKVKEQSAEEKLNLEEIDLPQNLTRLQVVIEGSIWVEEVFD